MLKVDIVSMSYLTKKVNNMNMQGNSKSYGQILGGCWGDNLEYENVNKFFNLLPLSSYDVLLHFKK